MSALMPAGCSPRALAWTGSKSTNHDLKIARAIASSVSLIFRFNSILSSRERKTACNSPLRFKGNLGYRQSCQIGTADSCSGHLLNNASDNRHPRGRFEEVKIEVWVSLLLCVQP